MEKLELKVEGMMCGGCENRIQNALKTITGVEDAIADHTEGAVKIVLNQEVDIQTIKDKIEDIGFEVKD